MSAHNLSFQFKIDTIIARDSAPPTSFTNGSYKPPIQRHHYRQVHSTGWLQWTINGVSTELTPSTTGYAYSTSIFYDGVSTNRFLFHPNDCQVINISNVEHQYAERYGWQQLSFTEKSPTHTVLNHDGEFADLRGHPGSYSPYLLPSCYRSMEPNTTVRLSGKMSLLLALTAFSCRHDRMIDAIGQRLDIKNRRWINGDINGWGNGRKSRIHKPEEDD